jgi:hypothetical protein
MNLILFTMKNLKKNLSLQQYNQEERFNTSSILDLQDPANTHSQPNLLPNNFHVDAEVQTKTLWKLFKNSLKNLFCINSSDIDRTSQDVRVENMVNNLEASQNIQANEVINESSESNVQEIAKGFDITDKLKLNQILDKKNAIFDHNFIDGIEHIYVKYGDTVLSVCPDLVEYFV